MSISLRTLLLCALSGCAPPPAAPDAGTARDAELTDASLDAGCASPDILDCIDTTPDPTCAGTWLAAVRGRLVDDSGGPVANARAQLCVRLSPDDRLVCLDPPRTEADGSFTIIVADSVRCMRSGTLRYVVPRGGFASTYCPFDLGTVVGGIGRLAADAVVFQVDPAIGQPPLGDDTVSRVVDLGPVVLDLVPSTLGLDAPYEGIGARAIDPARSCLSTLRAMEGAIALVPEARIHPGSTMRLRLAGTTPGERIEVSLLGGLATELPDGTFIDEGQLVALGTGTVGGDGLTAFPPEVSLTYLSWLGWRHAP